MCLLGLKKQGLRISNSRGRATDAEYIVELILFTSDDELALEATVNQSFTVRTWAT